MGNIVRHGIDMYKQTMKPPASGGGTGSGVKNDVNKGKNSGANIPSQRPLRDPPSVFFKETEKLKLPALTPEGEPSQDSKYRRVAKFLILIGSEQAAGILAELDPDQISEISKEIALVKVIKPEERDQILAEFQSLFSAKPFEYYGPSRGGIETARRILYLAKGPKEGEDILNKAIPKSKDNLFGFLEEYSAEQLVTLLKDETDQTAALLLSRMTAKISAELLSKLPPHRKAGILKRIAHQSEVSPEVLEQVSAAMKEKIRNISVSTDDIKIDGMQALTAILKQGDYSFGDKLINEIEKDDPLIGQNLKEKLYTLDDILLAVDRPIQDKLSTMTDQDIAVLLKGRGNEFCEKIMSCVSAGRRKVIREESEVLGAVPKRDCDSAARDFLSWFRNARENGEILLTSDEDVVV
jgi:flagellar motor switch protein FliG